MIDVALLSIIRRWHLRDHVSLREIAKRLGISRNTVRRYLRSGTIEPTYSRAAGPTVLDGYAEKLSAWLKAEATHSDGYSLRDSCTKRTARSRTSGENLFALFLLMARILSRVGASAKPGAIHGLEVPGFCGHLISACYAQTQIRSD